MMFLFFWLAQIPQLVWMMFAMFDEMRSIGQAVAKKGKGKVWAVTPDWLSLDQQVSLLS